MFTLENRHLFACTAEERESCNEIIAVIEALANLARAEGYLALEGAVENCRNKLLQMGIYLVLDGTSPEIVDDILTDAIVSGGETGVKLLKQLLIKQGVISIQKGYNPRIIVHQMKNYLGWYSADDEYENILDIEPLKARALARAYVVSPGGLPEFGELLSRTGKDIHGLIGKADYKDLMIALKGAETDVRNHIFSHAPEHFMDKALREMALLGPLQPDDIATAQRNILNTLTSEVIQ